MARVYIGGPGGSGKTQACNQVAQKLGVSFQSSSEIMMRAAGVSTRGELERLPEDVKNNLRLRGFEDYYKTVSNLVMDGHFHLTATDAEYFDAYVLVETDIDSLIEYRRKDRSRVRALDRSVVEDEMARLEERVSNFESQFGIKVFRVRNDGTLDQLTRSIEGVCLSAISDETKRDLLSLRRERK